MSDLTAKFSTLEAELTTQAETAETTRLNIYALLGAMADTVGAINVNNATNTRLILNAITASQACNTCPTVPLSPTPPVDDETPATNPFCQRVQGLLAFIGQCCTFADDVGTLSSAFSTGFITAIVDQIRVNLDDSAIPYPAWLDTIVIAADGVNFVVNRALFGGGAHAVLDPLLAELQSSMYAAGSPSGAKAAFDSLIDSSSGLSAAKPLIKGFMYGDVVNYYLDPASSPNVDGFNGAVCGIPEGCFYLTSQLVIATDASYPELANRQMIFIPDWAGYDDSFLGTDFSDFVVMIGGVTGGTITQLTGGDSSIVYHDATGNHRTALVIDTPFTITATTDTFFLDDVSAGLTLSGPWSIQYCPSGIS